MKKIKLKKLRDQVIVITGASSGIGLTTARYAAKRGARVVLAARSGESLERLEDEIRDSGGRGVAVEADVSSEEDVRRIAETAKQHFGGFDTWVNNAGVSIFGKILEVPVEEEREVFDVNFWGVVYGSKIAAEHLRSTGGAIINIGSVASDRAVPLQGAYSASKHAVKAYTDTLRSELEHDGAPVSVTLIKPTAIDTPFFRHAETHMDGQPTEPSPMYAPKLVAEAILRAAETPMRDILVGDTAPLDSAIGRWAPKAGDKFVQAKMFEGQKSDRRRLPGENKALRRPSGELRERGDYPEVQVEETSVYTKAAMHPVLTGVAALGAGLAMAAVLFAPRKVAQLRDEQPLQ
jgi:short-subunit dehydrogenase